MGHLLWDALLFKFYITIGLKIFHIILVTNSLLFIDSHTLI